MGNSVVHHVKTGVIELAQDEAEVEVDGKPAADASKHEWVDYATAQGWEVEGMTKAEIIDSLGE